MSLAPLPEPAPPLRVAIAGGGVGGLTTALALLKQGCDVTVYEKTAAFARFGGPIQFASNALSTLKAIDERLFTRVMDKFTFTGTRRCGIKDGLRSDGSFRQTPVVDPRYLWDKSTPSDWFVEFPLKACADFFNLPYTGVVDRPDLQEILLDECRAIKADFIKNGDGVVAYDDSHESGVQIILASGATADADVLVGADGIWSQVRKQLEGLEDGAGGSAASGAAGGALDEAEARRAARDTVATAKLAKRRYSGFTCYAALSEHKASNIEEVSYQILLGSDKYFVSTDGGGDRQQWFALVREPAGGVDELPTEEEPHPKLARLRREFADAAPGDARGNVWDGFAMELVGATPECDIKRRDLYDGAPLGVASWDPRSWWAPWSGGNVALCGDAAHPMMPNLGQGGCQSTEDGFRLAEELATVSDVAKIPSALAAYSRRRVLRTSIVQGFAQLGSDLLVDFDLMMTIPVVGPFFLKMTQLSMPWVLRFLYTPEF
mmetsp:Transcript_10505/g.37012  ORF Transcript_10505/g.37012 Transcript_10505/m.37012 type:complete len:491 (+) Transcript_10505:392-1864(+)